MPVTFKCVPLVKQNVYVDYKMPATVTSVDVGKPVKLKATDEVELCSAGDPIFGFINSVEAGTTGGKAFGSVQVSGRRMVKDTSGASVNTLVQAAAPSAIGTAESNYLAKVATRSTPALTDGKFWRIISGTGVANDETCVISNE